MECEPLSTYLKTAPPPRFPRLTGRVYNTEAYERSGFLFICLISYYNFVRLIRVKLNFELTLKRSE